MEDCRNGFFHFYIYPFVEPFVIPATRNFLKISATIAGGITAKSPAAAVTPYCTISFVINSDVTIATGFVSADEARISGI